MPFKAPQAPPPEWRWDIDNDTGQVSIIGHCLATPQEREAAANAALSGDTSALWHLPGCYSTLVSQPGRQIATTDPAGVFPFYWRDSGGDIQLNLSENASGSQPNTQYLAALIIECPELTANQTAWQGVHQLQGGQTAYLTKGGPIKIHETDVIPDAALSLDEAAEHLRQASIEAIDRRLQLGKVITSDCSGGRDSTTWALLVAERMAGGLDAFIHFLPNAGDLPYARRIVQDAPNLRLHEIRSGPEELPFQNLIRAYEQDESDRSQAANTPTNARLRAAQAYGSQVHLTGDGGDVVLDAPPNYLVDLARQSYWPRLKQECRARADIRWTSAAELFGYAQHNAGRTLADDLRELGRQLISQEFVQDPQPPNYQTWIYWPGRSINFLTAAMRRQLGEQAQQHAAELVTPEELGMADYTTRNYLRSEGEAIRALRATGQALGLDVHAPFVDKRIVEACLQLPSYLRTTTSQFKQLHERAFRGMLPETLFARSTKANHSRNLYRGLRAARHQLIDLLRNNCRLADLGVIEPGPVLREIERLDMGLHGAISALDRIVTAELQLRQTSDQTVEGES